MSKAFKNWLMVGMLFMSWLFFGPVGFIVTALILLAMK